MARHQAQAGENLGPWDHLFQGQAREVLPKGQLIYSPKQPADDLLLVAQGRVALYVVAPDGGRTLVLRVIEPGQVFGHMAAAEPGPYDTYAQARTRVHLYRVGRQELAERVERLPGAATALLESFGEHRMVVSRLLDEVTFKTVPARLAALLLDLSRGNGQSELPRHSHRQLAEMINAYRETVTKVINQFRAARLLEIDRYTITLVNRSGLEELAQG